MTRRLMKPWKSVSVLIASAVLAGVPALAQQIGTATAVNPLSESTPPGATTVALTVGARIVHKERIHTTPSGSVQLLFLDKSTLSIAPNTSILIDEYVYDPNSGNGHMLARLTEGTLRYVGGKLSHEGEAEIATPAAAVGIRGATGAFHFDRYGLQVIDLFGTFTIHNGAGSVVLMRPGFYVTVKDWNTPPSDLAPVPEELNTHFMKITTSTSGQNAGVGGLKHVVIGDCGIRPAGPAGGVHGKDCPETPWVPTDTAESDAFQTIITATQRATAITGLPVGGRRGRGH